MGRAARRRPRPCWPPPRPSRPRSPRTLRPGAADFLALPDGLALDGRGRPLVVTHTAGQVWRADEGRLCAGESGLPLFTQLTYGRGARGFCAGRPYRAGVDGEVYEVPVGAEPGR